jgi:hypothetical protein
MNKTYIVRARLDLFWDFEEEDWQSKIPKNIPVEFGPFRLDRSPNHSFYLERLGIIDSFLLEGLNPDDNYPISILNVELKIQIKEDDYPEDVADETLEQLEAMLRLFQEGAICLRRHYYHTWELKDGNLKEILFLNPSPPKPEPATLYDRKRYKLNDETLEEFLTFFKTYWDIVQHKSRPIYTALLRFNSSYERRTLSDRVIELMIAMEALFGDKDYQRYKIPLRCACMLYPPGKERKKAFTTIREFYDKRSEIVHGGRLELDRESLGKVDQFEDYARRSIWTFLKLHKNGNPITSGAQLDDMLFFN